MSLKMLRQRWENLTLARQFGIASFLVLLVGMLLIASWVGRRIESGVVHNSGVAAALYMDSFVAPLIQAFETSDRLPEASRRELDRLIDHTPLGESVLSYKIWLDGGSGTGLVAYSSRTSLIGERFPMTGNLQAALNGKLHASFDDLHDEEDRLERASGVPLLEIYSPIRSLTSGRIIAVSEFYSAAEDLQAELLKARLQSWLLFGAVGLGMFVVLSGIALRGSRTIERQRSALESRVGELSRLRNRLERSSRRTTELNETLLRRVGSDLHDGPGQLVALALLKLDELRTPAPSDAAEAVSSTIDVIRDALAESMQEIRNISSGLAVPAIEGLGIEQMLNKVVTLHERRTGVHVTCSFDPCPEDISESIMLCIYRFAQESLFNAFHHGGADRAELQVICGDDSLSVRVRDRGVGFDPDTALANGTGLGLPGLRERIESVGGQFELCSRPGEGTTVEASFELSRSMRQHAA